MHETNWLTQRAPGMLRTAVAALALMCPPLAGAAEIPETCDYVNNTLCCVPTTLLDMIRDWLGR